VTYELGRGLLLSGAVSPEKLSEALFAVVTQGIPLARALVGLGVIDEAGLEKELAASFPGPLTRVLPSPDLMERLPPGLCHRLGAAPVSVDEGTGAVEVAVLDPRDTHPAEEIGYHLKRPVRPRRATYGALREALEAYPAGLRALAAPMGAPQGEGPPPRETPLWGTRPPTRPPTRSPAPPGAAALSPESVRGPSSEPGGLFADGAIALRRRSVSAFTEDGQDVRFKTRTWDSADSAEPVSREEASWDAEPVFELRRLGPPPTVPDPEPVTVRLTREEAAKLPLKKPLPHPTPPPPWPSLPLPPRVPTAPNAPAPPYADLGSTLASIRAATDRDAVLGLVQLGARSVARRVAMLVVRKDSLAGWSCTPEFGDEDALKELKIPLRAPNLLTAILAGGVHLGPLMGVVGAPLLRVMRTASQDVAIAAIRVGDRPAVLIVADELGDTLLATKRLDELARAAGDALLRILRSKRE
jgi:Type II secretion system (T2SS), protein E, N-terminal domain